MPCTTTRRASALRYWNRSLLGPRLSFGLLVIPFVCATAGCSGSISTGHDLSRAPYYKSFGDTVYAENRNVGHLPVVVDAEVTRSGPQQVPLEALQPLLDEINSYIDSLGWSAPLVASSFPAKGAPLVDVGSSATFNSGLPPSMTLWITKPAPSWRDALTQTAAEANIEYVLYLSLGFSEYSKRATGLVSQEVELGTGYRMQISWTSDIEKPVVVFHIKGILLDREGNIVRAGAEGMIARDTPFLLRMLDGESIISTDEAGRLLTEERRDDLPGQPPTWRVSTQNLLAQLLMREETLR